MASKNVYLIVFLLLLFTANFIFSSCGCSCTCSKETRCKIISAQLFSNRSITTSVFCSETPANDSIVSDSIRAFTLRYQPTAIVSVKDSVFELSIDNLTCGDTGQPRFKDNNYICNCAK